MTNRKGNAALYRASQFLHAIAARVNEDERIDALGILTPEAREMFRSQCAADQRHALAVHRSLVQAGQRDEHLLAAALLHDVGKSTAPLPIWQRTIIVLMERFAPHVLARASRGDRSGWRRAFVTHASHAEVSAQMAAQAGCSALTADLVRRHHDMADTLGDKATACLLTALQSADGQN